MGLKADLDEVVDAWHKATWRVRLWLALSLFAASGSIASLSESVAKWKGFFLESLAFYRQYISDPFNSLASTLLGFDLPARLPDAIIMTGLLLSANFRIAIHRGVSNKSKTTAFGTSLGALCVLIGLLLWEGRNISQSALLVAVLIAITYTALQYWHSGGAARILWFAHIVCPFILVGLAAAINSGLAK